MHLVKDFCPVFGPIRNNFILWFQLGIEDCAYSIHEHILLKNIYFLNIHLLR